MDTIIAWLLSHSPTLGLLLAMVGLTFWSTWRISAMWKDVKHDISDLKDRADRTDSRLEKMEVSLSEVQQDVSSLKDRNERTDNRLEKIEVSLSEVQQDVSDLKSKSEQSESRLMRTEAKTETHSEWKISTDCWKEQIEEKLTRMDHVLSKISEWVMKKDNDMIESISQKQSPRQLTPVGLILYEASGAKKLLEEHLEDLICALEKKKPQTAYDVEEQAYYVAYNKFNEPYFKPIKDFLYLAPDPYEVLNPETGQTEPVKLNIITMSHIISLPLRDEYLKRHPELDPMATENEAQDKPSS
ncbi:MAG: hypothetical protein Q4A61_03410 [Porphyromonadaceae bacterium]|nr:hypothetical protein [Porphyromonadaceae bacterium]